MPLDQLRNKQNIVSPEYILWKNVVLDIGILKKQKKKTQKTQKHVLY